MMMMEYSEERTANAVGGKTARACENCLRKRARWFCSADDAFLCQACDKSVHSANNLASRHERVRLETSSSSSSSTPSSSSKSKPPVWHQGFTRKPRTPRHNNNNNNNKNNKNKKKGIHVNSLPLVPEIGGEESCLDENEEDEEEEFLYRVPEFDLTGAKELNFLLDGEDDAELAEFAADVESLLNDDTNNNKISSVKIENDDEEEDDESFSWDDYFDYSAASPAIHIINNKQDEEDVVKKEEMMMTTINNGNLLETKDEEEEEEEGSRKISLKLNYEEVMNAWDNNSLQLHQPACPWLNGIRPDFNPSHNSWPDFLLLVCIYSLLYKYSHHSNQSYIKSIYMQSYIYIYMIYVLISWGKKNL